jgi:hypothetical protein
MENVYHQYFANPLSGAPNYQLKILMGQLRMAFQRLAYVPAKWPEFVLAVALFQRLWLEIEAWLQFQQIYLPRTFDEQAHPIDPTLMGAWSYHLHEVQALYNAGIPVWWVRNEDTITEHTNILSQTWIETIPDDIVLSQFVDEYRNPDPFPILHQGLPGPDRLAALRWGVHYHLEKAPPSASNRQSAPATSSTTLPALPSDTLRQAVENITGVSSPDSLRQMVRDEITNSTRQSFAGPIRTEPNHSSVRVEPYGMP